MKKLQFLLVMVIFGLFSISMATTFEIEAGTDDSIDSAYVHAAAGDTIMLTTSGGVYYEGGTLTIEKDNLTIMAKKGLDEKPMIVCDIDKHFELSNVGITFDGVILSGFLDEDGDGVNDVADGKFAIKVANKDTTSHVVVKVLNCEVRDYFGGDGKSKFIYSSDSNTNTSDSIIVRNTVISRVGFGLYVKRAGRKSHPDGGYFPKNDHCLKGGVKYLEVTNCLFDSVGSHIIEGNTGIGFYIASYDTGNVIDFYPDATIDDIVPTYNVNHCTFTNTIGKNLYFDPTANICVKNSIFAYADTSNNRTTTIYMTNTNYLGYDASNVKNILYKIDHTAEGIWSKPIYADSVWNETILADTDPMFIEDDPCYQLQEGSPAVGAADDGKNLGYVKGGLETAISTDVQKIPTNFSLEQNYPNPFNPTTTIKYFTPRSENVTISVYNVLGQRVKVLVNQKVGAGNHSVEFKATDLASGVYIYRLKAGNFNSYKKMILMK